MNDLQDPPTDKVARDAAAVAAGTAITCPACGMTSHNKHDVREKYCGNCHWFTSDPILRHRQPPPRDGG